MQGGGRPAAAGQFVRGRDQVGPGHRGRLLHQRAGAKRNEDGGVNDAPVLGGTRGVT